MDFIKTCSLHNYFDFLIKALKYKYCFIAPSSRRFIWVLYRYSLVFLSDFALMVIKG